MDEIESLFRMFDTKYRLPLVQRVRQGVVTAAASPNSYSITLPGDTAPTTGVPSVSAVVPQVTNVVRVAMVADQPVIVGVVGGVRPLLSADVTTNQTTSTTTYTDLATTGPAVTLDLVAGQTVLVTVQCRSAVSPTSTTFQANMSFAVSGVESLAAADANAAENTDTASATVTRSTPYTAAVTGSHTFTAKYRVLNATTGNWLNRRIIVAG